MKTKHIYKEFIFEAENFWITQFIRSEKIDSAFSKGFSVIFDPKETRGVVAYHEKYGQGKTFFFDVLHSMIRRKLGANLFLKTSSKELVEIYKSSGEDELLKFITVKNLFIDDIGAEIKEGNVITKNFGNSLNVIEYVIFKRYEMWSKAGWKLHGTTNIGLDSIGKLYGGRVADRFVQMCEILEFNFTKGSFRQVKNVRPLTEFEKKANLERLYPKEEEAVEKADVRKYLNELMEESEEVLIGYRISFWTFLRTFLEREELIVYKDITEKDLEAIELLARSEIRRGTESAFKNLDNIVARREKEKGYKDLNKNKLLGLAKNKQVRNKILSMKSKNLKF